ncbi:hypothetical protein ACJMK2_040766 [Sinanodonta woodiana]|uniref:Homeobox domain-containing protein n=1 Tax=Sinanodonta woodiana TaxID=1069815 RepID=A0ABD3W225_SINWO
MYQASLEEYQIMDVQVQCQLTMSSCERTRMNFAHQDSSNVPASAAGANAFSFSCQESSEREVTITNSRRKIMDRHRFGYDNLNNSCQLTSPPTTEMATHFGGAFDRNIPQSDVIQKDCMMNHDYPIDVRTCTSLPICSSSRMAPASVSNSNTNGSTVIQPMPQLGTRNLVHFNSVGVDHERNSPPPYNYSSTDSGYTSPVVLPSTCTSGEFQGYDNSSHKFPECTERANYLTNQNSYRGNDASLFSCPSYAGLPSELHGALQQDCSLTKVPSTLLCKDGYQEEVDVAMKERELFQQFRRLEDHGCSSVKEFKDFYQSQSSIINVERNNILQQMAYDKFSTDSINGHYNSQLLQVINRMAKSLFLMESDLKSKPATGDCANQMKKGRLLPKNAVKMLETWYCENISNPYPSRKTTFELASKGGLTVEQIRKWFANKRNRSRSMKLQNENREAGE